MDSVANDVKPHTNEITESQLSNGGTAQPPRDQESAPLLSSDLENPIAAVNLNEPSKGNVDVTHISAGGDSSSPSSTTLSAPPLVHSNSSSGTSGVQKKFTSLNVNKQFLQKASPTLSSASAASPGKGNANASPFASSKFTQASVYDVTQLSPPHRSFKYLDATFSTCGSQIIWNTESIFPWMG